MTMSAVKEVYICLMLGVGEIVLIAMGAVNLHLFGENVLVAMDLVDWGSLQPPRPCTVCRRSLRERWRDEGSARGVRRERVPTAGVAALPVCRWVVTEGKVAGRGQC